MTKLIWLSHFVPFPPRGGNLQRSYNLIRQAARSHEVHLFALNLHSEPPEKLREYEKELRRDCASVEICELPFRWRGARWWIEALGSPLFRSPFSCRALFSKPILGRWTRLLGAHPDALLHFDSIDLALYADSAANFRKVLNHHNCESAMAYRQAKNERNPVQRGYMRLQAAKIENAERGLCARFDVNTVVSAQDGELLRAIQPRGVYHVVENGVDTHLFAPVSEEPEPHSAIFSGLLGWGPNISAMDFLAQKVWPLVKKRFPDARLYLAGRNPPEHVRQWPKQDPTITVVPNPEDMRPWIARASVCVCPILEGGGTRLKILDAFAMGKPMVSTTIGCEGLRVTNGENILIADSPQDFAAALARLFDDASLRRKLGSAGRALVEREYSWDTIGRQLDAAYLSALDQKPADANSASEPRINSPAISR